MAPSEVLLRQFSRPRAARNIYKPRNHFKSTNFALEMEDSGAEDPVVQIVKAGAAVLPGWGAVVETIERPGKAFTTDNLARAEWSIFDAEAKGPSAGAEASTDFLSARAFAKAELASASASAGPVKATVGLSADTGFGISPAQVEAKVLGTGFSIGRKVGVSLFGTGVEFELW